MGCVGQARLTWLLHWYLYQWTPDGSNGRLSIGFLFLRQLRRTQFFYVRNLVGASKLDLWIVGLRATAIPPLRMRVSFAVTSGECIPSCSPGTPGRVTARPSHKSVGVRPFDEPEGVRAE